MLSYYPYYCQLFCRKFLIIFQTDRKIKKSLEILKTIQKIKTALSASRGKGYPFPRLLVFPQTPNANFFKICKTPSAWLFLFLEYHFYCTIYNIYYKK